MTGENNGAANQKTKAVLEKADIYGENVFTDVWLPFGDEKESDIQNLIQQKRITR